MGPLVRRLDERFTYGDYLTWDDDERWELIDGVPYNMSPALRVRHQRILVELSRQIANYLVDKPCQVFFAPFDVRLPESDWFNQIAWASGLNNSGVITYNLNPGINMTWGGDWRVPSIVDGIVNSGTNITTSEMGHLYYSELGNLGWPQLGYGLTNTGSFAHLMSGLYWTNQDTSGYAWYFDTNDGIQSFTGSDHYFFWESHSGLAIRPGVLQTSSVPEPSTFLLLGAGLGGLAFWRKRKG